MAVIFPKKIKTQLLNISDFVSTREQLVSDLYANAEIACTWHNLHKGIFPKEVNGIVQIMFMKNSWQLTNTGALFLGNTCECYKSCHVNNALLNGRVLVNMGKIIESPWYNKGQFVYVWKQTTYFELQMFDGDIHRFIEFRIN
jgi:hypothetical protein